jgi:hypothetical protein
MKAELKAAESILSRRSKIRAALADELGKLQNALDDRIQAERDVQEAEVAETLGEGSGAERARKRLETAHASIAKIGNRLTGLRVALAEQSGDFAKAYDSLNAEVPAHLESLKREFAVEWERAITVFAAALGKKAMLEGLCGEKLTLPEPKPAQNVDLGEAGRPHKILAEVREALAAICAHIPQRGSDPRNLLEAYHPELVYVLQRDFQDSSGPLLTQGTKVVGISLDGAWLDFLAGVHDALPYLEPGKESAVALAERKIQRIQQAEAEAKEKAGNPSLLVRNL